MDKTEKKCQKEQYYSKGIKRFIAEENSCSGFSQTFNNECCRCDL